MRLLQDLVSVPSVTGEEGVVQEVVGRPSGARPRGRPVGGRPEEMAALPRPCRGAGGVRGPAERRRRAAGTGGGRSILLNAHVDTVPSRRPARLDPRPASAARSWGDRLYGRGSCDMKGGLVTHLAALARSTRSAYGWTGMSRRGDGRGGGWRASARLTVLLGLPRGRRADHRADAAGAGPGAGRFARLPAHGAGERGPRLPCATRGLGAREVPAASSRRLRRWSGSATPRSITRSTPASQQGSDQLRGRARRELGLDRARVAGGRGAGRPDPRRGGRAFREQ